MGSLSGVASPLLASCRGEGRETPLDAPREQASERVAPSKATSSEQEALQALSPIAHHTLEPSPLEVAGFSSFPCADPSESPAQHNGGMVRDERAHLAAERAREQRQLSYFGGFVTPRAPVDALEVVLVSGPSSIAEPGDKLAAVPTPLASRGTLCSGASDPAACAQSLGEQRRKLSAGVECSEQVCAPYRFAYALSTRGNRARAEVGPKALKAWLGAIESPVEAWLLLAASEQVSAIRCGDVAHSLQRTVSAGYELRTRVYTSSCEPLLEEELTYRVTTDGKVELLARRDLFRDRTTCVVGGRRPAALVSPELKANDTAGALFARMAHLERASVAAFDRLATELRALGAEVSLLQRVARARADELRHAGLMEQRSRRHGHALLELHVGAPVPRSLLEIALENAVEGCVRELFGALVVRFQAQRASELELRQELAAIAEDETAHAALAYDVASWLAPRLTRDEQAQVHAAVPQAVAALAERLSDPSAEQREVCGMPTRAEASALLHELRLLVSSPACAPA